MVTKHPHVAIIGAGLGGLCLAQGLRKHGVPFDVFERDASPSSRTQGYRIRIDLQGQKALRECLPERLYELFCATSALPVAGVNVLDTQLNDVMDRWVSSWKKSAGTHPSDADQHRSEQADDDDDLNVHRMTLREVLMSGIEERVHFGKAFSHYEERDDETVVAHFSDGSTVVADMLVAADGVHSTVRKQRLPGWESIDTGSVCVYGKTYVTREHTAMLAEQLPGETSIIFDNGASSIIDAMHFRAVPVDELGDSPRLSPVDDYLYWAIIGMRARFGLSADHPLDHDRDAIVALVDKVTQSWSPTLKALFDNGEVSSMALVAVRSAAAPAAWAPSRVTVLGDAIHVMSPAGGLGANTALRDAALLADKLGSCSSDAVPLLNRIGEYEEAMRAYSAVAIHASREGSRVLFGQDIEA
ncbi:MAG: NAD(P)/FAD-dependent oxidoreductase [Rhodanobacter sp.]